MKVQDLVFGLIFLLVLWRQSERLSTVIGLLLLLLAIPLFQFWIFFTAERLTWYAAALFAYAFLIQLIKLAKETK